VKVLSTRNAVYRENAQPGATLEVQHMHGAALSIIAVAITIPALAQARPSLTTAVIEGSTAYSAAELFEAYREQLGQPITRDSSLGIVTGLQALYERDGYARPEVSVDAALAEQGILRVEVYEPHITRVIVSGDAGPHRDELDVLDDALLRARPIRKSDIQQALRGVRELPGLRITASTRRDSEARNGFELAVDATFERVDGLVRLTNRGTGEIGPVFAMSQFVTNGLLGWQEKLGVLATAATDCEEYYGAGAFLDAPAIAEGSRLMLMGFSSLSNPTETGTDLDETYRRDRIALRYTQRMSSAAEMHWSTFGAFELEDLAIDAAGTEVRDDQLRIVTLGTRLGWRSGDATQYSTTLEALQGLDAFGAGLQADDLVNDPRELDFRLLRVQFGRVTRLSESWSVKLDGLGQYSGDVLPDSQRFKIGGDRLGRGFEIAEIAGDSGIGAKLELRRELTRSTPLVGKTSAYGFYDFGAAWKQDLPGRESAATAGVGVGFGGEYLTGYCELATPLTHTDVEGGDDASVFAELSYRF
jgi:hemolysin activation/secretion protein